MGYARQVKVKSAALAHLAFHTDLPTEFFHDAPHDRQPQSMPLGANLIQPRKRREQAGLLLQGEARAVVMNPKADQGIRLFRRSQLNARRPSWASFSATIRRPKPLNWIRS